MPAGVRKAPSVEPADMDGTTGMPGHIFAVSFSTGPKTFGLMGCGPLGTSLRLSTNVTLMAGSPTTCCSVSRTCAGVVPGNIRQLMLASARWGRALLAWPALSKVATQVVCRMLLELGSAARIAAAFLSCGSLAKADMAAPNPAPLCGPNLAKDW